MLILYPSIRHVSYSLLLGALPVGCANTAAPSAETDIPAAGTGDLQAYTPTAPAGLSAQAATTGILAVNAVGACSALNLSAPAAVNYLSYGAPAPLSKVTTARLDGNCSGGAQPFSAAVPSSPTGQQYALL